MKTITCSQPGILEYSDAFFPEFMWEHAIIKVRRIGLSRSDLRAFAGAQPFVDYPRILGGEISGELVGFDNAPGFQLGELVTINPYFHCGSCAACRLEKPNYCENIKIMGVHVDGAMVEYLSVPSNALLHGEGISLDDLVLVKPLAEAAYGVKRAAIQQGEYVMVVGADELGLGIMEFTKMAGGKIIVLETNKRKLQFCQEHLGIEYALSPKDVNCLEEVRRITNGNMASVIIDSTGNLDSLENYFQYMAHGARIVWIGMQNGKLEINDPEFQSRKGFFINSYNATKEDFEHVLKCIRNEGINPSSFISHRVTFAKVVQHFDSWLKPATGVIKAVIEL